MPPAARGHQQFTTGIIKEAVFQVLAGQLGDLSRFAFCDLCAGSGQMAFEAASLGFRPVFAFDVDQARIRHLRAESLRLGLKIEVGRRDFRRSGRILSENAPVVAYFDPPYSFWRDGAAGRELDTLLLATLVPHGDLQARDLVLVVQAREAYKPPDGLGLAVQQRRYRGQIVSFLGPDIGEQP